MSRLHYGSALAVDLDNESARLVAEMIGAHASRGGWVEFADRDGKGWSVLITPGVPVWFALDAADRSAR